MCDGGATRKIIPYTFEIQRTFTAHHENNIVAPRGELTTPEPVRACPRRRAERGVKAVARQARNPSWHHLSAALNTRWFIHEDSLTAITLIRLINGCRRGEMGRHTHRKRVRKQGRRRRGEREKEKESCNVIQTDDISQRLTLPQFGTSHFSLFFLYVRRDGARKSIFHIRKRGANRA